MQDAFADINNRNFYHESLPNTLFSTSELTTHPGFHMRAFFIGVKGLTTQKKYKSSMKFVDAFQQFGHILFYYNVETTMWHLSFSNDKANKAIAFSSLHEILDRALRTSSPFPEDVEQAKIFTSDYENLSSQKEKNSQRKSR
ncbi:hypothetical protein [Parachlamydia acanthamoebae]|uniref:hypothetical protein n=1 Tax=Parachlamydia acanthamoebae TaxID=83552 RepID=UPI001D059906|nr:hypothetical protein [Parachlamydia acanthamoebae]